MFGHFITLCMKGLKKLEVFIGFQNKIRPDKY